ncbi:Uncharacterised protein [Brucella abortus]|nr:Uncharacterised protein [Brucella abortus]
MSGAKIEKTIGIGGIEQKQGIERRTADSLSLIENQKGQKGRIIDQHKEQPDADGDACRRAALAHQRAREKADRNEDRAKQNR